MHSSIYLSTESFCKKELLNLNFTELESNEYYLYDFLDVDWSSTGNTKMKAKISMNTIDGYTYGNITVNGNPINLELNDPNEQNKQNVSYPIDQRISFNPTENLRYPVTISISISFKDEDETFELVMFVYSLWKWM